MIPGSIEEKIRQLKQTRNAVILAHNYQLDEVQEIADFTGDSLELSQRAAKTEAAVIVFCGVHFMAETAAILSPRKTVLLPDKNAGCPMADMITADELRDLKAQHPGAVVVCYVNSTAEVKAESDYCCTSSNAVSIVRSFPAEAKIIFVPDQHLGQYVIDQTHRSMILWPGFCPTHMRIGESDIARLRTEHPGAEILVHPECSEPVKKLADQVLSTSGMCRYAQSSSGTEFIIGTEVGILHRLRKENPGKRFYAAKETALCPNMKQITLEKLLWSLEDMQYQITVPEAISRRARLALERMIHVGLYGKS